MIIDRFEGSMAVIELPDKSIINLPQNLLPQNSKEGDVLKLIIDKDETERRKTEIEELLNKLWK
jgi:hypothetical protein